MDLINKYNLRKTASGVGFCIFASSLTLYISSYAMVIIAMIKGVKVDSTFEFLISTLGSVIAMFAVGLLYCAVSHTSIQSVIPVKKVQSGTLFKVVLVALAVSLLANYITDMLLNNLSFFGYENHLEMEYQTYTPLENLFYIFSVAVMPALVEEFMFRGILLHKLRKYGDGFAVLCSSLIFGLIHGNLVQIPFAFIVGLALGFIVIKTGSIIPSMIVHFIVNCSSVLITIMNNQINENVLDIIYILFLLAVIIGAIFSAVSLGRKKDFFSLSSNPEYPQKEALINTLTSSGMIFSLIFVILEISFSLMI